MEITETSIVGQQVLEERQTLIIGISLNNSYFKEENLRKLITWATGHSESVYIMIPDEPAVHTLSALGETEKEAQRIAQLKSNNLANKCNRIIQENQLTTVRVIRWKDFKENASYVQTLFDIKTAYGNDVILKQSLREATTHVLHAGGTRVVTEGEIDLGTQFLFKELAFITHADTILGVQKVAYVYHRTMPVLREIVEGIYSFKASPNIGFITAE